MKSLCIYFYNTVSSHMRPSYFWKLLTVLGIRGSSRILKTFGRDEVILTNLTPQIQHSN